MTNKNLDELCINTIRLLSADAVEEAQSGHPGLPMGAAALAYTLWTRHLRFNPANPDWLNRDRFVLSAGHGSMLLYSLLHLTGYDLPLEEIKHFRQWGSKTPGHPEHGHTPGVETTTGPLGQGFANAVGMAMAEKFLADRYNRQGLEVIDYRTYVLASDGDLMEGISSEAASIAGGLKLSKLICLYDSNHISIEGSTDLAFHDDTAKRFKAYDWQVLVVDDGNDVDAVDKSLTQAKADPRPSLIILHTHIGFGSPNKQDSSAAHGSALGAEELKATKKNLGWPSEPPFLVPKEVRSHMSAAINKGQALEANWQSLFNKYQQTFPEMAKELSNNALGQLSSDWQSKLPSFDSANSSEMATREASGLVMNTIAASLPLLIGGSADLGPSNNTALKDFGDITTLNWPQGARNLHFGIREHAMGAILNGLALSKAIRPFGGTFLCFSDYMRPSIRLAAIMKLPVIYIFTHDSIAQGEDGTTHQPVEHLASLRAMPGLSLLRPADANETLEAWKQALLNTSGPTALILTRQKVPLLDRKKLASADKLRFGAYIIKDCLKTPDILFIATGSEVYLAIEASTALAKQGVKVRVVSMPSTDLFDLQSKDYQESVLPPQVTKRLVIEAASAYGWSKYAGNDGAYICIDEFGSSAPGKVMMEKYGFTTQNIVSRARELLKKEKK